MTAVAAISHRGRTWFGADSAITDEGGGVYLLRDPKVRRSGGYAYGCAGESLFSDLLDSVKFLAGVEEGWVRRTLPTLIRAEMVRRGIEQVPDGEAIIGAGGRIWILERTLAVHEPRDRYAATGTAMWTALGVLYATPKLLPRQRLTTALRAAARYDQAVRPPFRFTDA